MNPKMQQDLDRLKSWTDALARDVVLVTPHVEAALNDTTRLPGTRPSKEDAAATEFQSVEQKLREVNAAVTDIKKALEPLSAPAEGFSPGESPQAKQMSDTEISIALCQKYKPSEIEFILARTAARQEIIETMLIELVCPTSGTRRLQLFERNSSDAWKHTEIWLQFLKGTGGAPDPDPGNNGPTNHP